MTGVTETSVNSIAGSYLTFHLSQAKYALPVCDIQYITTIDSIDPHQVPVIESEALDCRISRLGAEGISGIEGLSFDLGFRV